jgi:outer membrane protein OmpA-like peptidoglycan-associated protein
MSLKRIFAAGKDSAHAQEEHWIPLSDLMTGLMMMFMLVAITFMVRVESDAKEQEAAAKAAESQAKIVSQIARLYDDTREEIYKALYAEFKNDLPIWRAVLSRQDLALRFVAPEVQFDVGKDVVKPEFERILAEFFPRYIKIITSEKYRNTIEDIRIEGHTSSKWGDPLKFIMPTSADQAYVLNMGLSQARAFNVLKIVLSNPTPIVINQKEWLKKYLTANGMSSSRPIEVNGKEDDVASQRVEFKIRTKADERIGEILKAASR